MDVRREIRLGNGFDADDVERAVRAFRATYNVAPTRAMCSPDVLVRYCELEGSVHRAHARAIRVRVGGVPLEAAVLAPGTIAFLGEVDELRMGDW